MDAGSGEKQYFPKPDNWSPRPVFPPGHKKAGMRECQAWNKNQGRQCENSPMDGKRVCWVHGGASPSGIASPSFRTGRYSKHLPVRFAASYENAMRDENLVSLRAEISLIDARTEELLSKIDAGESYEIFKRLRVSMSTFDSLNRRAGRLQPGDSNRDNLLSQAAEQLNEIRHLIQTGLGDWAVWADIKDNLQLRKTLADSERRRLVDLQQMMTSEQARILIQSLTAAVLQNVTDRTSLSRIQSEFIRILSRASVPDALPGTSGEGSGI